MAAEAMSCRRRLARWNIERLTRKILSDPSCKMKLWWFSFVSLRLRQTCFLG